MSLSPRPHDLLRLDSPGPVVPADAPGWVGPALRRAPWVVVRRANAPAGFLPVGVRGRDRSQRHGLLVRSQAIAEVVTPEQLAERDLAMPALPAARALAAARPLLDAAGLRWGPGGSVGFELATGVPTVTATSDLDLVLRSPTLPFPADLTALHAALQDLPAHGDCRLELPGGAVVLDELVSGGTEVLLRTAAGPRLVPIPARES